MITKIEWTATPLPDGTVMPGYTFNPWIGCTKVSEECKFCYAENLMAVRYGRVKWGAAGTRSRTSDVNWKKVHQWDRFSWEIRKKHGPQYRLKVFCASLADIFEGPETINSEKEYEVVKRARAEFWMLIAGMPNLDFLILTKRPENIMQMVPEHWKDVKFPENVWIGTSIGTQGVLEERLHHLARVPAKIRFLSMEPLIEGVTMRGATFVDWVIVGGESGHGARPMHPDWARSIRDWCKETETPYFFKQWGEWMPTEIRNAHQKNEIVLLPDGSQMAMTTNPRAVVMRNVGKHAAGRELDGKTYSEYPAL